MRLSAIMEHSMIGLLVGKYRIEAEIGRGAMGIVFRAQETALGHFVALKILAEKLADDPEMLYRFEREGGAASALRHPNICNVVESGNWKGRPYFAMELLTGQTLDERLKNGPLAPPQLIDVAIGAASALEAAHAIGVVHRDIKPANLFLTTAGKVKVLDFGLAKRRPPSAPVAADAPTVMMHVTRQGMVLGTLAYMSPEQLCCEPLDGRADLYSLGVTLYELATGTLPIRGAESMAALPAGLGPIIVKLMASDARKRYQNAREAREAFEGCVARSAELAMSRSAV
jgi:eukaryotic-like serine/threonine-protein kinase